MSVTVADAGPFEKLVTFTVSDSELDAAKSKAARRLSREVNIRGFRPGKAPRPIVEATVGAERLRSEAVDELLPDKVGEILTETELAPAVPPRLERLDDTEGGIEVEVRVTLWPKLESIPEHHGRTIEVDSPELDQSDLEDQIARIRDQFAELETVERPAAAGDFVSIDVTASRDGREVPEATASDLLYEVGSAGFIEGIDDVLEGMSAGDAATFTGVLPSGFGDRAGLSVDFSVTVGEVRQKVLPELTDEWVSEITEFDTVEEMRDSLTHQLADAKKRSVAGRFREKALEDLVEQVEIDLPDALIRAEMDEILHRFVHRLEDSGIELDDYFRVTGIEREAFVDDLRGQADRSLKTRLLLEAVADQDGIEVIEEELDAVIDAIAARTDEPDRARVLLRDGTREKSLADDILRNKALDAIVAGATPVDEDGNPVDLTVVPAADEEIVEGEIVAGEQVDEGDEEVVTAEIVEGEVVEAGGLAGSLEEE